MMNLLSNVNIILIFIRKCLLNHEIDITCAAYMSTSHPKGEISLINPL